MSNGTAKYLGIKISPKNFEKHPHSEVRSSRSVWKERFVWPIVRWNNRDAVALLGDGRLFLCHENGVAYRVRINKSDLELIRDVYRREESG
jgi:hypothetical protein